MLNWIKKLLGLKHTVTVDGAQLDRLQRDAARRALDNETLRQRLHSHITANTRGPGIPQPPAVRAWGGRPPAPPLRQVREDNRRRDSTDEMTPLLWPVLVSDSQVRGMDSMSASLSPAEPPAVSSGGGGDYGGGGASGSWDSGSSSDSGSSCSASD